MYLTHNKSQIIPNMNMDIQNRPIWDLHNHLIG